MVHRLKWIWTWTLALSFLLGGGLRLEAQALSAPTTLDFGEVVVDPGGGSFTIDSSGSIIASSGVYPTSNLARSASATVANYTGQRSVTIYWYLFTIPMSGPGAPFSIDSTQIKSEFPGDIFTFPGKKNNPSTLTFHLAGTIAIPAGQTAGDYTGTLPIFIQDNNNGSQSNTVNVPIHIRIIAPIALSKVQDLDMGTVIPGATAGSVTLNAATGAQNTTGGVVYASPSGQPAQFAATGQPSHPFTISLSGSPITLTGSGGTLSLALLASPSGSSTFSGTGTAALNIGGTLTVNANQAEGDYTGTFSLTVAYP